MHSTEKPAPGDVERLLRRESGARIFDLEDAEAFKVSLSTYTAANTSSVEAARRKLQELGIYDAEGRLTENYR